MNRRAFVIALGLAPSAWRRLARATPSDADLVRAIVQRLSQGAGLRARFTQKPTVAALNAPLTSRGDLLVARDLGVVWRVTEPFRSVYVVGAQGVTELDPTDMRVRRSPRGTRAAAGATQASAMARALANGDLSSLYAQFEVRTSGSPDRWSMLLVPDQPQLKQVIGSVRLEGGAVLKSLCLNSPNGDVTLIELVDVSPFERLSDSDRAWFEAR
ncbi:putative transmembrane protein [Candidatus Burkholderia verschuerenii]|uniref:Putative transmembrane protein n=1 Tax=Candidatus Burkholderia verschuerenii TaxID=242163 RepID=A0A0L0MI19_9BURK|nr:outer membrane lipoprotein carrier protein LolA [Candidatus Burkholderia verschuerenii]KND61945.1 putative transmembrane protein [Candidatus Burkholderia verschuerenii]